MLFNFKKIRVKLGIMLIETVLSRNLPYILSKPSTFMKWQKFSLTLFFTGKVCHVWKWQKVNTVVIIASAWLICVIWFSQIYRKTDQKLAFFHGMGSENHCRIAEGNLPLNTSPHQSFGYCIHPTKKGLERESIIR